VFLISVLVSDHRPKLFLISESLSGSTISTVIKITEFIRVSTDHLGGDPQPRPETSPCEIPRGDVLQGSDDLAISEHFPFAFRTISNCWWYSHKASTL